MKRKEFIVGLDVGTTKVSVIVAEAGENGVELISIGNALSRGIKKGAVININDTANSIKKAISEAELTGGINIKAVYAGLSEGYISSISSHGVIAVNGKEIGYRDIEGAVEAAKAIAIPVDREVLHVISTGFTIDGQNGINDPTGMAGVRLEANVQIVTAALGAVQNLIKSCQSAGIEVIGVVFNPVASASAILMEDEKDVGVGIVDIGGGTTDIALYHEGSLCYTSVLPVGGNNFTNDVAIGLRMQTGEAESIKKKYGCALLSMIDPNEEIEITYAGNKPSKYIPRQHLIEILQPRAEELFILVKKEITKSGYYGSLASGVVLTGGVSLMSGIELIAENILELPVRVGAPKHIRGLAKIISNPIYAAGVGLVLYGVNDTLIEKKRLNGSNIFGGMIDKVYNFSSNVKTLINKKFKI
ncbi:MAG: cell division protein FtsA [Nitrospirae bacterium]|nr:cell division protein FtsA [Nitrospirota bacterium]